MQHAIRHLTILDECGEQVKASDPPGSVSAIRAELRLPALDFWLRRAEPDLACFHQELKDYLKQALTAPLLDVLPHP